MNVNGFLTTQELALKIMKVKLPPSFDGSILTIGVQGKTVEFPISHSLYENIKEEFNGVSQF